MSRWRLSYLTGVADDLNNAIAHYQEWRPDGKEHFLGLFHNTTAWIQWNPKLFSVEYANIRHAPIPNSYYGVFYFIEDKSIHLTAVFDTRRNPSWIHAILSSRKIKR